MKSILWLFETLQLLLLKKVISLSPFDFYPNLQFCLIWQILYSFLPPLHSNCLRFLSLLSNFQILFVTFQERAKWNEQNGWKERGVCGWVRGVTVTKGCYKLIHFLKLTNKLIMTLMFFNWKTSGGNRHIPRKAEIDYHSLDFAFFRFSCFAYSHIFVTLPSENHTLWL